jgi:hypothetical protein
MPHHAGVLTLHFELIKVLFLRGSELVNHVLALELPQLSNDLKSHFRFYRGTV